MTRIVSELRTFARPSPAPGGTAEVARAVAWAVRATALEFRARAPVSVDVPPELARVQLDETRLGQVVVNLLINAAHAIPAGRYEHNAVSVSARARGAMIELEVRDSGAGIPPELVRHIFERFFTTKDSGSGTGLGLAICHGIVTSAGGTIEVVSDVGRGTTFRVALPAAAGAHKEAAASPPAAASPQRRGRILAVDDEALTLQAITRMLDGHDVVRVQDAREAIALVEHGEHFDLIITDIMMPHMNGMELFEHLLALAPAAARRVVFLTAGSIDSRIADFLAAIPNDRLDKPITTAALRAFVDHWLAAHDRDD